MAPKVIFAGAMIAAALALTACGPDSAATDGTTAAGGAGGGGGGGGGDRDSCLIGTWKVDVEDMAHQAAAIMTTPGATGTGTGTITLVFGDSMTITYDDSITLSAPMSSGLSIAYKAVYTGAATSTDWKATGGLLAGTMPTNTVSATTTATIGGTVANLPPIPFNGALDLSQAQLGYTCAGNAATFSTPKVVWHLTKA